MNKTHKVSPLGKTWIFDLDGTLVKHNGYKIDGEDSWLEGALEYLRQIPKQDMIVFLTSRTKKEKDLTESFLAKYNVRWQSIHSVTGLWRMSLRLMKLCNKYKF